MKILFESANLQWWEKTYLGLILGNLVCLEINHSLNQKPLNIYTLKSLGNYLNLFKTLWKLFCLRISGHQWAIMSDCVFYDVVI